MACMLRIQLLLVFSIHNNISFKQSDETCFADQCQKYSLLDYDYFELEKYDLRSSRHAPRAGEQRLFYELMESYSTQAYTRPVLDQKHAIDVYVGMHLVSLMDVVSVGHSSNFVEESTYHLQNEKNRVITTALWMKLKWTDAFLHWDPMDFDNITNLRVPYGLVWTPDIVITNQIDKHVGHYYQANHIISHDGTVEYVPPLKVRTQCTIDITFFPIDRQLCVLHVMSYMHTGDEIVLHLLYDDVDLTQLVPSGQFQLIEATQNREIFDFGYGQWYTELRFSIDFKRRVLYYLYSVLAPCVMMSVLCMMLFFLPPESNQKIALGIIIFLTFCVYTRKISDKVPEPTSSPPPIISIYLIFAMSTSALSILVSLTILIMHYTRELEMPTWVEQLMLHKIRSFLGVQFPLAEERYHLISPLFRPFDSVRKKTLALGLVKSGMEIFVEEQLGDRRVQEEERERIRAMTPKSRRNYLMLNYFKAIKTLFDRDDDDAETQAAAIYKWRLVAIVIDRVLFYVYLLVLIATIVAFCLAAAL